MCRDKEGEKEMSAIKPLDMMERFVTKSTGDEPRKLPSGAQRDSRKGKGRFDLIPAIALKRLAQLYERGAEKYGENNWQKGQPLSWYIDSAARHLNDFMAGDRSEDHITAVAWNAFGYVTTEARIKLGILGSELDDVNNKGAIP